MIYLDHHATTPVDPSVMQEMLPWFTENPGNPHSRHHEFGWRAEAAVSLARKQIADLIGADDDDVVFTSGATESNNWVIKGIVPALSADRRRILTLTTEHPCVMQSVAALAHMGWPVGYVPVDDNGWPDRPKLEAELAKGDVGLLSIMLANNEIGVIQPVAELARLAHAHGALFHTDAAQAVGRISVDVGALDVDFMSFTAHKFNGPKGIGALYIRAECKQSLAPLMHGGGQEGGLRSGTVPTPLVVGFGAAADLASRDMRGEMRRIMKLRSRLMTGLQENVGGVHLNGAEGPRLPGNLNICIDGVLADDLIRVVPDVAVSTGSACSSVSTAPSHVLTGIGLSQDQIARSIRIGIGRSTTDQEIEDALAALSGGIERLRGGG